MYNFLVDLDLLTASLLLCSLFIVFATINIKRSKKVVMKLIWHHLEDGFEGARLREACWEVL